MRTFRSYSSVETKRFGERLAKLLSNGKQSGAIVLALHGNLGAGKTTLTQGFAKGLGIKKKPNSPTFVILRRYPIRIGRLKNFYHIDLYRIKKSDELETLGLKEILADPASVVLIEWPEKVKDILPKDTIFLDFRHGKREEEREIDVSAAYDILNKAFGTERS